MKIDAQLYNAIKECYPAYRKSISIFGNLNDLLKNKFKITYGSIDDAKQLVNVIETNFPTWYNDYGLLRCTWRIKLWKNEITDNHDMYSIEPYAKDKLWVEIDDNINLAQATIIDLMSEWIMVITNNAPYELRKVKRELRNKDYLPLVNLKEFLITTNQPLISSNEIKNELKYSQTHIGRLMSQLGYQRRRVIGHGENQWLWILSNDPAYLELSPKNLISIWENKISFIEG